MKLLKQVYKTYEGARKAAAFENGVAPSEFARGDKAKLYRYTVVEEANYYTGKPQWRVQREAASNA